MEHNRFDRLTKTFASWTSRRTLLGGLSGAAALALTSHSSSVRAQTPTPNSSDCVTPLEPSVEENILKIRAVASWAFNVIPDSTQFKAKPQDHPAGNTIRLQDFVGIVKCNLGISRDPNTPSGNYPFLLKELTGIYAAFATAYFAARGPSNVHVPPPSVGQLPPEALPNTTGTPSSDVVPTSEATLSAEPSPTTEDSCNSYPCIFDLLGIAETCQANCLASPSGSSEEIGDPESGDVITCYYQCDAYFFALLFGDIDLPAGYEQDKECLLDFIMTLTGGCLHGCCPPGC